MNHTGDRPEGRTRRVLAAVAAILVIVAVGAVWGGPDRSSAGHSYPPAAPSDSAPAPTLATGTSARPAASRQSAAHDAVVGRLAGWDGVDAECIVVVDGLSAAAAVDRMGGDGTRIAPDTDQGDGERSVTDVGTVAGHTVLLMDNGWTCHDDTVLDRLTAGGRTAVTAWWNADADARLSYARNGEVLATWDPVVDNRQGPRFDLVKPWVTRTSADVGAHPYASMLAVVAGVTGVEVPTGIKADYTVWLPNE